MYSNRPLCQPEVIDLLLHEEMGIHNIPVEFIVHMIPSTLENHPLATHTP